MKRKFIRAVAGCIVATVLLSIAVSAEPIISADSAVLLDGLTGRVIYEKNAHQRAMVASTTKIMTGLLIAESCDLQANVQIPAEAVGIEGSSIYLKENEILTVETLLYGMMLHSGNDAATALALYCAGSEGAFVEKMNRRAAQIGLSKTNYVNPHGLDADAHYSTAFDLARLAAVALENEIFYRVVSAKTMIAGDRTFVNHNKMLWKYEGAIGVKTGYTMAAGRILVSAAERNGRRLICVTIRDKNDWADHAALLDYGFSSFDMRQLAASGTVLGEVPVLAGAELSAQTVLKEDLFYCVAGNEEVSLCANLPAFVYAPILAGDTAGTLSVLINGIEVLSVPLYWRYSVLEGT